MTEANEQAETAFSKTDFGHSAKHNGEDRKETRGRCRKSIIAHVCAHTAI